MIKSRDPGFEHASDVTLDKSINFARPPFPYLLRGNENNTHFIGLCRR